MKSSLLKRASLITLLAVTAVTLSFAADPAPKTPAETPTTQPAGPVGVTVAPDAKELLDKVSSTLSSSKGLTANGTFAVNIDVAGDKKSESVPFTSSYSAPFNFKHQSGTELTLGGTGEKLYVFKTQGNQYLQVDWPKAKASTTDYPAWLPSILSTQNPLLLSAISQDPSAELTRGASAVTLGTPEKIGEETYPTIALDSTDGFHTSLAVDPKTNLIRRVTVDASKALIARGAPEVKAATLTTDYTDVSTARIPEPASFAWMPAEGAVDAAKLGPTVPDNQADSATMALVGKAFPDFTLKDIDGKDVSLSSLKGQVVVLDFWATWCPPCREGLKMLNKVYAERKGKGLVAYAVNQEEEKSDVVEFRDKTGLTVPILMDSDAKVANSLKMNGLPITVLIGKDGIVKRIDIGFYPSETDKFTAEVDAAMAAK